MGPSRDEKWFLWFLMVKSNLQNRTVLIWYESCDIRECSWIKMIPWGISFLHEPIRINYEPITPFIIHASYGSLEIWPMTHRLWPRIDQWGAHKSGDQSCDLIVGHVIANSRFKFSGNHANYRFSLRMTICVGGFW